MKKWLILNTWVVLVEGEYVLGTARPAPLFLNLFCQASREVYHERRSLHQYNIPMRGRIFSSHVRQEAALTFDRTHAAS
jgi:hypothetical protein